MCCRSDFNAVLAHLPCYLPKGSLKREDFLGIYLTTFFGVCKLKNVSAMRVTSFPKIFKIESRSWKSKEKLIKDFLFLT